MRTSRAAVRRITSGKGVALASALCIAAGLGFGTARGPVLGLSIAPAFAFDGTTTPNTAALSRRCLALGATSGELKRVYRTFNAATEAFKKESEAHGD